MGYTPVTFETQTGMYEAFFAGKCTALTQDISALASTIVASGKATAYLMLPGIIAKDPLAAYVRSDDERWFDVVRWTFYAMLDAEERGITQGNVDEASAVEVRRRARRQLDRRRTTARCSPSLEGGAFNTHRQAGRQLQRDLRAPRRYSPLRFARGVRLWNNDGALYPLPLR